jgi:spore maturation protein CgeB
MRIVYIGFSGGTSSQRAEALRDLGHEVQQVVSDLPRDPLLAFAYRATNRLGRPLDVQGINARLLAAVRRGGVDVVWVDKGLGVWPTSLRLVRRLSRGTQLVFYSPDDMFNPRNQSTFYVKSIPLYDLHVTTKSFNVPELMEAGARAVEFIDNAYDPTTHRPIELTPMERARYACDIGFVGGFEAERADVVLRLARSGLQVRIWGGPEWKRLAGQCPTLQVNAEYLDGMEYTKAVNATRINLGFLRKANRDLQTQRTVEVPACGGFLLAERTDEQMRMFEEGREMEFFGSFDELRSKCLHYLADEPARRRVAEAARSRCLNSGYSNQDRLRRILDKLV